MDLSYNRPGSSWPDKLHSQRPFPSLGKKGLHSLLSPMTVTNTSRGVVRLSSPWTTLKPKTTPSNVYILHPCFPYFYLPQLRTYMEVSIATTKEEAGVVQTQVLVAICSIIRHGNISKNYYEIILKKLALTLLSLMNDMFNRIHTSSTLGIVWPRLCLQFVQLTTTLV